jgi:adenylyltransferase/sulfurtransferase
MDRYSRQIAFFGKSSQVKLANSCVAIVGLGALGSVAAELLARAGIGKLLLIDADFIELNNLQRQALYDEKDIGELKTKALKKHLSRINSRVDIDIKNIALSKQNITTLTKADLILDCTDNIETRKVINAFCLKSKKPWIFASAVRDEGYVHAFMPRKPCFLCLFPKANFDESCCSSGVLNTLTHSIAAMQANECIKILLGQKPNKNLLHLNMSLPSLTEIKIKNKACSHKV